MKFFRNILIGIVALTGVFWVSVGVFAKNHIVEVSFVGDAELTGNVVQKIFDKVEFGDESDISSAAYGIRVVAPGDKVLYKFKNPLIANDFERAVSPECNMVFMTIDFLTEKGDLCDILVRDLHELRCLSNGSKVIVIVLNADNLSEFDLQTLSAARSLYRENNFDYILTFSTQDVETFRNNFFNVVDGVIDWRNLPTLQGDDLAVFRRSDPAGAIVSELFGDMVGMMEFKENLNSIITRIVQDKRDAERGKSSKIKPSYHMLLMGNPGTGKTTIARKMAEVFYRAGILSESKFLQVERKDLVGQYIGHTEEKVKEILKNAEGGVLFIDEAYSLSAGGERDFGKHVVEGMLTSMTDNRCIVIAAGYPDKMQEFLNSNPGLSRRFAYRIDIPDYSEQELFTIFKNLVNENGFMIQPVEEPRIQDLFVRYFQEQKVKLKESFGNAGSVENFFELVMNQRAKRLNRCPNVSVDFITLEDVAHVVEK